jgi:hypothetical protein
MSICGVMAALNARKNTAAWSGITEQDFSGTVRVGNGIKNRAPIKKDGCTIFYFNLTVPVNSDREWQVNNLNYL